MKWENYAITWRNGEFCLTMGEITRAKNTVSEIQSEVVIGAYLNLKFWVSESWSKLLKSFVLDMRTIVLVGHPLAVIGLLRNYLYNSSPLEFLTLASSPAQFTGLGNLETISLPGALPGTQNFIPRAKFFDKIVCLSLGATFFSVSSPTDTNTKLVAEEMSDLDIFSCQEARKL